MRSNIAVPFKGFILQTTLLKTITSLALLMSYSIWLFGTNTRFGDAINVTDGLPESTPGFLGDLPARALTAPGGTKNDYIMFQLLDVPYVILNALVLSSMITVGLKAFCIGTKFFLFARAMPALYFVVQIIEDTLLVGITMGLFPISGASALLQQCATLLKLGSTFAATPFALLGFLFAIGKAVAIFIKKN